MTDRAVELGGLNKGHRELDDTAKQTSPEGPQSTYFRVLEKASENPMPCFWTPSPGPPCEPSKLTQLGVPRPPAQRNPHP